MPLERRSKARGQHIIHQLDRHRPVIHSRLLLPPPVSIQDQISVRIMSFVILYFIVFLSIVALALRGVTRFTRRETILPLHILDPDRADEPYPREWE
jgi:hypothetical protein